MTPRLITALFALTLASLANAQHSLEQRLESIAQRLEERRLALHVPGLSIAIVKDGQVILARGFGQRDIERDLPALPETLWAIGSSTKTMTAFLVSLAEERAELGLDDHPREHLPAFHLADERANAEVTLRDLLSHRTGLTRMPIVWAAGKGSLEDSLAALGRAQAYAPFRSAWLYNNVAFATAGYAAAAAAAMPYEDLLRSRILQPLSMNTATTDLAALARDDAARGYVWNDETSSFDPLPARDLHLVAPAGALNASVLDMAKWVAFLLARGQHEGTRLALPETIERCWTPEIDMGTGASYALGWMVSEHAGHRLVEHGGNIDGYASTLALLPDDNLGFSLLMNVTASPLQGEAISIVFDNLLDSPASPDAPLAHERLAGAYAFEALGGDVLISARDARLYATFPGQGETALSSPDADGYHTAEVNRQIRLRFLEENDAVTAIDFRQGPVTLLLPRRNADGSLYTPPHPFTHEQLDAMTGVYHFPPLAADCTVTRQGDHLFMDVPGQMNYPLAWVAADSRWRFRDHPDIVLSFLPEAAPHDSIRFVQSGVETLMPRLAPPDADPASAPPTLEQLLALRRDSLRSHLLTDDLKLRITARLRFVHQGVDARFVTLVDGPRRFASSTDVGPHGTIRSAVDEHRSWSSSPLSPTTIVDSGLYLEQAHLEHPWMPLADFDAYFPSARVDALAPFDDAQRTVRLVATPRHAEAHTFYLDPDTARPLAYRSQTSIKGIGSIPYTVRLSDWREAAGLWFPFRSESENPATGNVVVEVESVEIVDTVDPDFWRTDEELAPASTD